jgi:hypothetical protein
MMKLSRLIKREQMERFNPEPVSPKGVAMVSYPDGKYVRYEDIPLLGVTMKQFIAGALLTLTAVLVFAKPFATTEVGAGRVTLYDEQRTCPDDQKYFELLQADLKVIKGCWKMINYQGQNVILLKDEEGDGGILMPDDFAPVKDV